jgi:hypothetical protein
MNFRDLADLASILGAVIFGYVLVAGVLVPYMTTPQQTVDQVQTLAQSTQPSLVVGGLGSLIFWGLLAGLLLTGKKTKKTK